MIEPSSAAAATTAPSPYQPAVIVSIIVWGLAMAGFGVAVAVADEAPGAIPWMLAAAVVMLIVGGAADMASAAFRQSILQSSAADEVRGRLQGIFIVVVAGGPRIADVAHGATAAMVGTAAAAAGGCKVTGKVARQARRERRRPRCARAGSAG